MFRKLMLIFFGTWLFGATSPAFAAAPPPPVTPPTPDSIVRDIQKLWQPGKVPRMTSALQSTSTNLTAPNSWAREIVPNVDLGKLSGFYYRYIGIPLMILLLGFSVYGKAMAGQFDPYDLLKRVIVVVICMVGASPIFQCMTTVQQGFPKLFNTLTASISNSGTVTDDATVIDGIRQSVDRVLENVSTAVVTRAARSARQQSHPGPDDKLVSYETRPYVDYMFLPLHRAVQAVSLPADSTVVKPPLPVGTDGAGNRMSWFKSQTGKKMADFGERLEFFIRYDTAVSEAVTTKIRDTFYNRGPIFQMDRSALILNDSVDTSTFKQFESELYELVLEAMTKVTSAAPLQTKFIVDDITGAASGPGGRGQGATGTLVDSSAKPDPLNLNTADELTIYVATSAEAANKILGQQAAVSAPTFWQKTVMKFVAKVNGWVCMGVLTVFTFCFNLMLRVQFFFLMLAVPFYMSEKTEKAFIGSFMSCITLVMTPLVGLIMLTIWNMAFAALMGAMLGTGTGLVISIGILAAFSAGQIAALLVLNICMMVYICFLAPKFTSAFLHGKGIGAMAVGGLLASVGVAGKVAASAAPHGAAAQALGQILGRAGRGASAPTADDTAGGPTGSGSGSGPGSGSGGAGPRASNGGASKIPDAAMGAKSLPGTLGDAIKSGASSDYARDVLADGSTSSTTAPPGRGAAGKTAGGGDAAGRARRGPTPGKASFSAATGSFTEGAGATAPATLAGALVGGAVPSSGSDSVSIPSGGAGSVAAVHPAPPSQRQGDSVQGGQTSPSVPSGGGSAGGRRSVLGAVGRGASVGGMAAARTAMLVFGIPRSWVGNKAMAADVYAGLKDAVPSVIRGPEHEQALHERQAGRGVKPLGNAEAAGTMERKSKAASMAP